MPSVLVISDPMSIVTNVTLVDEEEVPVDEAVGLLYMNAAVYQLPWQLDAKVNLGRTALLAAA